MAETLATDDIECIFPPYEAVDELGFLRSPLVSDTVHGNIGWGRLLIPYVLRNVHDIMGSA
jgi:hypothetical protein